MPKRKMYVEERGRLYFESGRKDYDQLVASAGGTDLGGWASDWYPRGGKTLQSARGKALVALRNWLGSPTIRAQYDVSEAWDDVNTVIKSMPRNPYHRAHRARRAG